MRLDKFLAENTDLSRSLAAKAVRQQRVLVNGQAVKSAAIKLTEQDQVQLDNNIISPTPAFRYWLLHKPQGYVCANADSLNPLVFDLLQGVLHKRKLHTVGRLDKDTSGLLLITDDGQWSHRLTSPKRNIAKTYRARLAEPLIAEAEALFAQGVLLDDDPTPTLPAHLVRVNEREALLTIYEGRYHQVKRMFAALGNAVTQLHREAIGALQLQHCQLAEGDFRQLNAAEEAALWLPHTKLN